MNTNKKSIAVIIICAIVFFSIGILFISKNVTSSTPTPQNIILQAKTDYFENLSDLEYASPIIVKGIKISENEPSIIKNEYGKTALIYTLSSFQVNEVFKNDTNLKIDNKSELPILENEAYDESSNTNYHIAGYQKMSVNKEYILFLYYSESDSWYIPTGVTFGKIPMDITEKNIFQETNETSKNIEKPIEDIIANEARIKYGNGS